MKYLFIFILLWQNLYSQEFVNYTVERGDTLAKISKQLLSDPKKWRELLQYNKIKSPNFIQPGLALKIPDFLSKKKVINEINPNPIAKVISKIGLVKLRSSGIAEWQDIDINKDLIMNDVVRTSTGSSAEIDFFEAPRTVIQLQEQSIIKIRLEEIKGIELKLGEILINTDKTEFKDVKFKFSTSASTGTVRGTNFQISSDDKISRYGCFSGSIEVSAQNQTVQVPAGYGTVVVKGKPPMKPFKLLNKVILKPISIEKNKEEIQ